MRRCAPGFRETRFEHLQWLFPVAVTLHNLEEGIWLPSWAAAHRAQLPWQIAASPFRIALATATVIAYLVTWLSRRQGLRSVWTYLFLGYTFTVFLNVLVPHVPASIVFRGYTPGVVTATMVNLPVTAVLLYRAWQERILADPAATAFVIAVPLGLASLFAVFFLSPLR